MPRYTVYVVSTAQTNNYSLSHSRDVFCGEVDDGWYEVLPDENGSDGVPVSGGLTNQQADALHGHLHSLWWICQGTNLNQLLLLDQLDSYRVKVKSCN